VELFAQCRRPPPALAAPNEQLLSSLVLTAVYPLAVLFQIPSPGIQERKTMSLSSSGNVHRYRVDGMTCEHCRLSVTEEVSDVAGVQHVEVDMPTGQLTVTGDVDDTAIAAAVSDAGYKVVA